MANGDRINIEYKPINPKELIVQNGEDIGRIDDIELAQIGAIATNERMQQHNKMYPNEIISYSLERKSFDSAGIKAMAQEIGFRAVKYYNIDADSAITDFYDELFNAIGAKDSITIPNYRLAPKKPDDIPSSSQDTKTINEEYMKILDEVWDRR